MPIPKPRQNETEDAFMSRCISFVKGESKNGGQAVAICFSEFRRSKKLSEGKEVEYEEPSEIMEKTMQEMEEENE